MIILIIKHQCKGLIMGRYYEGDIENQQDKIIWYARLDMGRKMEKFFKESHDDDLHFTAEL